MWNTAANHLIKQGNTWYVKVAFPADVQPAFDDNRAFTKTLKTSDKADAIARCGRWIAKFKTEIAEARGKQLRQRCG